MKDSQTSQVLHIAFELKDEDHKYACLVVYLSIIDLFTLIYSFILEPWMVQWTPVLLRPCITNDILQPIVIVQYKETNPTHRYV